MTDLIRRLRDQSRRGYWPLLGDEAADEIERLRAALQKIADHDSTGDIGWTHWKDMARAALKETP